MCYKQIVLSLLYHTVSSVAAMHRTWWTKTQLLPQITLQSAAPEAHLAGHPCYIQLQMLNNQEVYFVVVDISVGNQTALSFTHTLHTVPSAHTYMHVHLGHKEQHLVLLWTFFFPRCPTFTLMSITAHSHLYFVKNQMHMHCICLIISVQ